MLLVKVPYEMIPVIALVCNLIVVSGGAFHFIKNKHVNWKLLIPFICTSIPFAFIGGSLNIEKELLRHILGVCLLLAGIRMIFLKKSNYQHSRTPLIWGSSAMGALIGCLSGIVGIGGGIFLSPILYNLKWGTPKQISSICCLFIFFNSIAGLSGQISKIESFEPLSHYWPLALAVFIGGQIGSLIGATKLKPRVMELTTAVLILFVAGRILLS